jgi:hypothetical protein
VTRHLLQGLAVFYPLAALGLLYCTVTSYQHGSIPHALFFAGTAVLFGTAACHHRYQRDELRSVLIQLERCQSPAEQFAPAIDGVVAVALAGACCERWWTSAGAEHEVTCEQQRRAA